MRAYHAILNSNTDTAERDFARQFPIIAAHFFGVAPAANDADDPVLAAHYFGVDPIANDADTPALRDLRFRRHVELLHRRGPRALLEFLTAVGVERSITTFLEDEISAFADLDPDALAALGARGLPPTPLHRVSP